MREILFRGKAIDDNWYYGVPLVFIEDYVCMTAPHTYNKAVIPETVGQYTGLTDKNGAKIFEGDIIKTDNGRVSAISIVQYGNFEPTMFYDLIEKYVRPRPKEKLYGLFAKSKCGEEMFLSECSHLIEVIGNIHDNPELLGGVDK